MLLLVCRRATDSDCESMFVTPGQRVGHVQQHRAGAGTYVREGFIHASVVGLKLVEGGEVAVQAAVVQHTLSVGQLVTARVLRVGQQRADVSILLAEDTALPEPLPALIRREDVRAVEADKVQLPDCFRPADILRARVISLGDSRSYFLSTARDDLGVIVARSEAGAVMTAVSWREMQCPKTRAKEPRKVSDMRLVLAQQQQQHAGGAGGAANA